jgi:hypothetical protein
MLFPDKDGLVHCETADCDYDTTDLFDFLDHCGIEFTWDVRITPKHSFDLFQFFQVISDAINHGDLEEAYQMVQDTAFVFVNASSDELDDFIEESIVAEEADSGIKNIERMLRENGQG